MNLDVAAIGIAEFALRAGTQPGWSVLIVDPQQAQVATRSLVDELQDLDDSPVTAITAATANEIVEGIQAARAATVVVSGLDAFKASEWHHLDLLRSRLAREGSTILVLSPSSMITFAEAAPNLASWLGNTVWRADLSADTLSTEEVEQRLASLRASTGMSDTEVVTRAGGANLPRDPEFAEWLVLLGRGDLVPRE